MSTGRQGYLYTLDGWRAVAILAVLVDHVATYEFSGHSTLFSLFSLTRVGANGVSLFFAIRGFLICSRLLEEQAMCGRISLKGFYIRRACRVLPAAMTYLLFIALVAVLGFIIVDPREWLAVALFWRNYLPDPWIHQGWGGYTVHYWSLAVEEHFYFIWPALLVFSGKRRAQVLAIVLALVVAVWRWGDFHHQWVAYVSVRRDVRGTHRRPVGWASAGLRRSLVARQSPMAGWRRAVLHLHSLVAVCCGLFAFHNHSAAPLHGVGVDAPDL